MHESEYRDGGSCSSQRTLAAVRTHWRERRPEMSEEVMHMEPERVAAGGLRRGVGVSDPSTVLAPAVPTALWDTVVVRLRDSIISGDLAPGLRLREEQLAQALDVSRGPVRDALRQLEREGLVARRRNRGAAVAELSRSDLDEIFSLRLGVEPIATEWAARHASAADCAEMRAVIDTFSSIAPSASAYDAAEADLRFHDVVYRAARHGRLLRLWQDLRPPVCIFLLARSYAGQADFHEGMIHNHSVILSAILDGDAESARRVAIDHIQMSYARVVASYQA
jgi:DNA-binding GntR family transcriptional regulator